MNTDHDDDILNNSSSTINMANKNLLAQKPQDYIQNFSTQGDISSIIGLVSSVVSSLGIPIVGEVFNILDISLNLFWPQKEEDKNVTWEQMIKYTSDLIDERLTEEILFKATAELTGLKEALSSYQRALDSFSRDRNQYGSNDKRVRASAETIRSYIHILHLTFGKDIIANFTINNYEIVLLPAYASAATLHLMLLRDVSIYGEELNFELEDINFYYEEQSQFTKKYVKHCIEYYNKGLNTQKDRGWTHYNRYRRDMTLSVLDVIALFSNYDARIYPIATKTEITREIYSDVINDHIYGIIYSDFQKNEDSFTRLPHRFTWLSKLNFVTSNDFKPWMFLSGNQNFYSYTPKSSINTVMGPFYGEGTDYPNSTSSDISIADDSHIYKLWSKNYEWIYPWYDPVNITKISFSITDNKTSKDLIYGAERSNAPTVREDFEFPNKEGSGSSTFDNYSHVLSYMITHSGFGRKRHGYSLAFTHSSVDPYNTIYPDKITQIPSVKSYSTSKVVKGPGHTGGDVVLLNSGGSLSLKFHSTEDRKRYRIRLRYASDQDILIGIGRTMMILSYFDIKKTGIDISNHPEKYELYKYVDTSYITGDMDTELVLHYPKQIPGNVFIDKIEFIPFD
ncbi:pesticidal crystal protein cry19Ba [Clostridium puniceum]|uniref:Pesticidal crystal protein cry19Ba n=1 Tax=Clostridium puniceum TaxID=29367 RepID=A0A1S8TW68_9CLOT|nr:insecticidal delta-endotoxin Cry8Ea1 family protein [Clostridium puniceum]OOM82007.1 pesticidal crystal protein cry19Ba [Clostridium puniceum]